MYPCKLEIGPMLFLVMLLFSASLFDSIKKKIPNLLTLPAMAMAVTYYTISRGTDGSLFSLSGVTLGILILIFPYIVGGMGAGDVKLLGAVGSIIGPKGVFVAFLFTGIIGGLFAGLLLLYTGNFMNIVKRYWLIFKTLFIAKKFIYFPPPAEIKKLRLPYGIAISLGTIASVLIMNGFN